MTGVAWPFNETGTSGAPAVTARQLRQMRSPFAAVGTAARPMGAKSGVRVGTPASVVTITGSGPYTWNAGGFSGLIDGEANAAAGAYSYSFEVADTGAIATAGAAARVDRLDVQISDSDEGDGSATKTVAVVYTQGAATGGLPPSAPARSHLLAYINVPTAGAPTVSFVPEWQSAAGEWVFNTVAERDAYVTKITAANVAPAWRARVIEDTVAGNNGDYVWSGSTWLSIVGNTRRLPTAVTVTGSGATYTVSSKGHIAATAAAIRLDGLFGGDAKRYLVRYTVSSASGGSIQGQLTTGGTSHAGGSDYAYQYFWGKGSGTDAGGGAGASFPLSPLTGSIVVGSFELSNPVASPAASVTGVVTAAAPTSSTLVEAGSAAFFTNYQAANDGVYLFQSASSALVNWDITVDSVD